MNLEISRCRLESDSEERKPSLVYICFCQSISKNTRDVEKYFIQKFHGKNVYI